MRAQADQLYPRVRDLFGEVPVTTLECEDWVRAVAPNYAHAAWRMSRYIRDYDVAGKIRAAKLRGDFYKIIDGIAAPFDRCTKCPERF